MHLGCKRARTIHSGCGDFGLSGFGGHGGSGRGGAFFSWETGIAPDSLRIDPEPVRVFLLQGGEIEVESTYIPVPTDSVLGHYKQQVQINEVSIYLEYSYCILTTHCFTYLRCCVTRLHASSRKQK